MIVALAPVWVLLCLWPTGVVLLSKWTEKGLYSHGLLVLAMSVYAMYSRPQNEDAGTLAPRTITAAVLAVAALIWAAAVWSSLQALHVLMYPLIVTLAMALLIGWRNVRRQALAIGLLWLAMPVWEYATPPLQLISANAAAGLLSIMRVPVTVDDILLRIPEGVFKVASGCSGLSFLLVALACGVFASHLDRLEYRKAALVISLSGVAALAANVLRIAVIVVAGHLTDMEHYLVKVDHYYFGWILFASIQAIFLWIYASLVVPGRPEDSSSLAGSSDARDAPRSSLGVPAAILFSLLSASAVASSGQRDAGRLENPRPPPRIREFQRGEAVHAEWRPEFGGASTEWRGSYAKGSEVPVLVYTASFRHLREGAELISSDNRMISSNARLTSQSEPALSSSVLAKTPLPGRLSWTDSSGEPWELAYLYRVGNRYASNSLAVRTWLLGNIFRAPEALGVYIATKKCEGNCSATKHELDAFLSELAAGGNGQGSRSDVDN